MRLIDVDDFAVVEHGEIGAFAASLHQSLQERARLQAEAEPLPHVAAHLKRSEAQGVLTVLPVLLDVAAGYQRPKQAVDGRERQRYGLADLDQSDLRPKFDQRF